MAYPYNLADYRMLLSAENSADMESTLSLFQAFSKLYEHDRELLDDVLAADASSSLQVAKSYIHRWHMDDWSRSSSVRYCRAG